MHDGENEQYQKIDFVSMNKKKNQKSKDIQ